MIGVGLIGCGAIGRELSRAIQSGEAGDTSLVALFDQIEGVAADLAKNIGDEVHGSDSIDEFLATKKLEIVVECASPDAARAYAESVLLSGKDLLIMSSGALTDPDLALRLTDLAVRQDRRVIIPSGALGGIDAISATKGRLEQVTLTTTKPPRGLKGAPGFVDWETQHISKATTIFDGSAIDAVKLFPANVNVAATLSLAGLGAQDTKVKVIADPNSKINVHEVEAKGDFGTLKFRMELYPHERNPKTSFLAIISAIEALRASCSPGIKIGT